MITNKHIPIYHRAGNLLPKNRDLAHSINHYCGVPERTLLVDWDGNCFLCVCESWLPISVGKIEDFDRLEDIWSNPVAQAIQQDIKDHKYSHCAVEMCGIIDAPKPVSSSYTVSINIDESCNLACPSCRSSKIMLDKGNEFRLKLSRVHHLTDLLSRFDKPCHIVMSGNGDPLASHIMRPLIHELQPRPETTFRLFTNGLLIKKQLPSTKIISHITEYQISIDAGSAEVYEQVRLGGKWSILIENFDYLKTVVDITHAKVWLQFVLQKDNWRDMRNFRTLCDHYGWSGSINRLVDWSTWTDFSQHDVIGNQQHPEHRDAVSELRYIHNNLGTNLSLDWSLTQLATS